MIYLTYLGAWSTKTNSNVKENAELRCKVLKMKCYFYLQATCNIELGDEIFSFTHRLQKVLMFFQQIFKN